jgi:hypothetical protein
MRHEGAVMAARSQSRKVAGLTSGRAERAGRSAVVRGTFPTPFRPSVLGFAALAIAVALWGAGYKLSLYQHLNDRAKCLPVAKLWIEHRDTVGITVSKLRAAAPILPSLALLPVAKEETRYATRADVFLPALEVRGASTSGSLVPLRAPPFSRFLLN